MWLWRLWRWIHGEVRFRAEGGLCERFLNLLAEASPPVELWDIAFEEGAVTASCRAADYARLRPFARRTGTRVRSVRAAGAMKLLRPLRKRPGLLVGAAVAMAIYMLLATRMWVLDIAVDDEALAAEIEQQLAESGVYIGADIRAVDQSAVRMRAIADLKEVHQLSVYFEGCIARIEVALQEDSIGVPDGSPANIIAACDGRILSMRVSSGQAMVKAGEGVVEGDLLVCGAVETDKGIILRHASAVITAQTEHVLTESISLREYLPREGRIYSRPTLRFLMWEIPLYTSASFSDDWTVSTEKAFLTLFGTPLPVGITTDVYTERIQQLFEYGKEEAECIARERMEARAADELAGIEIIDVVYDGYWDGETYHLTAIYDCVEDIAVTVPLLSNFE